jgi:hypothetical protein
MQKDAGWHGLTSRHADEEVAQHLLDRRGTPPQRRGQSGRPCRMLIRENGESAALSLINFGLHDIGGSTRDPLQEGPARCGGHKAKQASAVQSPDPATFGLLSAPLAAVSLLAGYFPARRAMRVGLLTAMRSE